MSVLVILIILALVVFYTMGVLNQRKKMVTKPEKNKKKDELTFSFEPEIINIDFDYCQFRDGYFTVEKEDNLTILDIPGLLTETDIGSLPASTEETIQSALFYQNPKIRNNKRFHQLFPVEVTALKTYVLNDQLKLYIDRFDSNKYKFEIDP